jgi:hypothetical protein
LKVYSITSIENIKTNEMKSCVLFLLLIPSCAGITFGGSGMNLLCINNNSFNWIHEGEVKGCSWLKEESNKFRYDICADEIIRKACPTSCGKLARFL